MSKEERKVKREKRVSCKKLFRLDISVVERWGVMTFYEDICTTKKEK